MFIISVEESRLYFYLRLSVCLSVCSERIVMKCFEGRKEQLCVKFGLVTLLLFGIAQIDFKFTVVMCLTVITFFCTVLYDFVINTDCSIACCKTEQYHRHG